MSKTKGVELSLTGQLTDQLSVLAGYSYMDGKIEKSTIGFTGNHSALTPNNTANLWLKYQINDHWYAAVVVVVNHHVLVRQTTKRFTGICSCKCVRLSK